MFLMVCALSSPRSVCTAVQADLGFCWMSLSSQMTEILLVDNTVKSHSQICLTNDYKAGFLASGDVSIPAAVETGYQLHQTDKQVKKM